VGYLIGVWESGLFDWSVGVGYLTGVWESGLFDWSVGEWVI